MHKLYFDYQDIDDATVNAIQALKNKNTNVHALALNDDAISNSK